MYRPALGTWVDGGLSLAERNDNCFPTGDLGSIDRDGALHVDARRSDVITRGGVTINAAELETTLSGMAGVREASVIGQPHARLGERIVAFVEMQTRRTRDPSSLKDEAAGLLGHGKVPDEFVIVDALPRNAMGKVARPELVAYMAQDGMRE